MCCCFVCLVCVLVLCFVCLVLKKGAGRGGGGLIVFACFCYCVCVVDGLLLGMCLLLGWLCFLLYGTKGFLATL